MCEIESIQSKLKEQEKENNKKIFIHTHTAVREADEEPTRYFYSLLRTRQNQATMHSILKEKGVMTMTQRKGILTLIYK